MSYRDRDCRRGYRGYKRYDDSWEEDYSDHRRGGRRGGRPSFDVAALPWRLFLVIALLAGATYIWVNYRTQILSAVSGIISTVIVIAVFLLILKYLLFGGRKK